MAADDATGRTGGFDDPEYTAALLDEAASDTNTIVIFGAVAVLILCVLGCTVARRCVSKHADRAVRPTADADASTRRYLDYFGIEVVSKDPVNFDEEIYVEEAFIGDAGMAVENQLQVYCDGFRAVFGDPDSTAPPGRVADSDSIRAVTLQASRPLGKLDATSSEPLYFEVYVESAAPGTNIAVGLATRPYPANQMLGIWPWSIALHSDNGRVYSTQYRRTGDHSGVEYKARGFQAGDVVGCGMERVSALDAASHGLKGNNVVVFFCVNGFKLKKAPRGVFPLVDSQSLLDALTANSSCRVGAPAGRGSTPASAAVKAADKKERNDAFLGGVVPSVSADGPCTLHFNFGARPFRWVQHRGQSFYDLRDGDKHPPAQHSGTADAGPATSAQGASSSAYAFATTDETPSPAPSAGARSGFASYEEYQARIGELKGQKFRDQNTVDSAGVQLPGVVRGFFFDTAIGETPQQGAHLGAHDTVAAAEANDGGEPTEWDGGGESSAAQQEESRADAYNDIGPSTMPVAHEEEEVAAETQDEEWAAWELQNRIDVTAEPPPPVDDGGHAPVENEATDPAAAFVPHQEPGTPGAEVSALLGSGDVGTAAAAGSMHY